MNRFTRKIKNKAQLPVQVIILAAGAGARTRSYEPRCLLKYDGKIILDLQMEIIQNRFTKSEITVVGGVEGHKIVKRIGKTARFVENQVHEDSNSGESLRLAVNNTMQDNILFLHGDLVFSSQIFDKIDMDKSALLFDKANRIEEKEVGITIVDGKATMLSYNLPIKWCQIAYLNTNDTNLLRRLLVRSDFDTRHLLTFEIINKMIEFGSEFECIDIENNFIKEIDSLKDINNENSSR
jgi:choline kinase